MPIAGLLAWLAPGLGHLYLGERVRGVVCLITITLMPVGIANGLFRKRSTVRYGPYQARSSSISRYASHFTRPRVVGPMRRRALKSLVNLPLNRRYLRLAGLSSTLVGSRPGESW